MARIISYFFLGYTMVMLLVYSDCKEKNTFPRNLQDIKKFIELEKIKRKIKTNIRQFRGNITMTEVVPTEYQPIARPVLIFSEHADSQDCMLFPLTKTNVTAEEVLVQVDLWVYIKVKKMKRKETNRNKRKRNGRRLKIVATSKGQNLSILSVRVRKSKWHKIQLPLSLIQKILVNPDKNLILCLTCSRCNKRYTLVLMSKEATVGTNSKNRPKRKLSDQKSLWPFIVLHMKSQMF
ncbi:hypothetical protein CHS0354_026244 [Potamilus streckersoni]|uniref:Uncharacterized protein n=1 Tax=Potamilus streckersoni TaxID=2493646 RepID=A0AAE0TGN6_9BIVA|nr:hypothetical protein CHS0354_026244 [Potamilus streckersoni]